MSETTTVSRTIPASPERLFKAWLDPVEHGKMTGSGATAGDAGAFTAWDGYISGRTLVSTPSSRIEQAWRTTEFPAGAPDSTLTITFEPAQGGTLVTLHHENVPDGQAASYAQGWAEYYFDPMSRYFASPGDRVRAMGEAIGEALEGAEHQLEKAVDAVNKTRKRATREAVKAVTELKKVQKKAVAGAKAVGRKVKALINKPKTKTKTKTKAKAKPTSKGKGSRKVKAPPAKKPASRSAKKPTKKPSRSAPKKR